MKIPLARTWKLLNSKIHPPLPLSSRGSQQLLSLLNASFKQQLDRQHPADSLSNEHYADAHLQSILTDPLFNAKPQTFPSSKKEFQSDSMPLQQLRDHIRRHMDAFKELISQGRVDFKTAHTFLTVEYMNSLLSSAATHREAMQSSGAGSIILRWLWSSGVEDTGMFLQNKHKFVTLLVRFLVAEGQHARILRWLRRCDTVEETPFSSLHELDPSRIQPFLLVRLICEEITVGDGLDSAIALFLRAVDGLWDSGSSERSTRNPAIQAASGPTTLKLAAFEPSIVQTLSLSQTFQEIRHLRANPLLNAALRNCCKTRADPRPALARFQPEFAKAIVHMPFRCQIYFVSFGLKAARVHLKNGRGTEGLWILELLQTIAEKSGSPLSPIRKTPVVHKSRQTRSEETTNLHLLDTLAVQ